MSFYSKDLNFVVCLIHFDVLIVMMEWSLQVIADIGIQRVIVGAMYKNILTLWFV